MKQQETKINLGMRVLTEMRISQNGKPPYIGFSEIESMILVNSIKENTIKTGIAKNDLIETITKCTLNGMISLYGTGSCDFLIGQSAETRHKKDKEKVNSEANQTSLDWESNGVTID